MKEYLAFCQDKSVGFILRCALGKDKQTAYKIVH